MESSPQSALKAGSKASPAQPPEEEVVLNTTEGNGKEAQADSAPASPSSLSQPSESSPPSELDQPQIEPSGSSPPQEAPPLADSPSPAKVLEEDPDAMWYIRPTAGGQFGPRQADVMERWLNEGRVSRDSYVWREGWDDWRTAASSFPEFFSKSEPPLPIAKQTSPLQATPLADTPLLETQTSSRYRERKKSKFWGVTAVVVLGIVSAALAGFLVYILLGGGPG